MDIIDACVNYIELLQRQLLIPSSVVGAEEDAAMADEDEDGDEENSAPKADLVARDLEDERTRR